MSSSTFSELFMKMNHCSSDIMDNRVFYQHPDLMRSLCVHETVMAIMVNRLNKSKQEQTSMSTSDDIDPSTDSADSQDTHGSSRVNQEYGLALTSSCLSRKRKSNWSPRAASFSRTSVERRGTINERCSNISATFWRTAPCCYVC